MTRKTKRTDRSGLAEYRRNNPEINEIWPVDSQTIINGTRPTFQQLEILKKFFGADFSISDIKIWSRRHGYDVSDFTFIELTKLAAQEKQENAGLENTKTVEIDLTKISNGKSKTLLTELLLNTGGIRYNPKKHGIKQPDNLRDVLTRNGFENAAKLISKKGDLVRVKEGFSLKQKQ